MQIKPGSIKDIADSMAMAMADAFKKEWPNAMDKQPVPAMNDQMMLMFVAIAQGVVNHLATNFDAFKVAVADDGSGNLKGTVTSVDFIPPPA